METVVVSVGSCPSSDDALRFAVEEAHRRGARLRVIYAWEPPLIGLGEIYMPAYAYETFLDEAKAILREAVQEVSRRRPSLECEGKLREGPLAGILPEEARGAALVVLGTTRRGTWARFLMTSLTDHLSQRVGCPVTVVRQEAC